MTSRPASASARAAASPTTPAPMTTASTSSIPSPSAAAGMGRSRPAALGDQQGNAAQFRSGNHLLEPVRHAPAPVGVRVGGAGEIGLLGFADHVFELDQHQPGA